MNRIHFLLKTAFHTGKGSLMVILGAHLAQGVVTSLEVVVWQKMVDGIVDCLDVFVLSKIVTPVCAYMILACASLLLGRLSSYVNWKYAMNLTNEVNNALLSKCAHVTCGVYHDADFYDELSRINSESAGSIVQMVTGVAAFVQYGMAYVSVFVILAKYGILIPVVSTLLILPLLLYDLSYSKKLYDVKCEKTEEGRMAEKLSRLFFSYKNIMEIRTYGAADALIQRVKGFQHDRYGAEQTVRKKQLRGDVYINALYIVCLYALKLFAIVVFVRRSFTIGVITMAVTSIDQISTDLQCIVSSLAELKTDRLYVEALQNFLEREEELPGKKKAGATRSVRFEHVSYRYPGTDRDVLHDVSFSLETPGTYLLAGPNGCGKSTLIKLVAGFYPPDAGKIYINGIDMNELDKEDYYRHLCIMYQEYNRYPLSVRENITLGSEDITDVDGLLSMVNLKDAVDRLDHGTDTILDNEQKDGTDLSLGQWQKLAFARAMRHGGDFLICDEPTASVDAETSAEIRRLLLMENWGKLVLFISHNDIDDIYVNHRMTIVDGKIEME